jgi:phosphoribosylformylglycinamidine synthase subunit PurQ / glutaminase
MMVLVITGCGLNCEEETAAAYRKSGADARIVHAGDLFAGTVSLASTSVIHLSGGFSFGDNLGSGRVFVNRMRRELRANGSTLQVELAAFVADGGHLVGVCNGFQILVKSGFLPNVGGNFAIEATLTHNDSGNFEDRWVHCVAAESPSAAFRSSPRIDLPVRHGEGKLVVRDSQIRQALIAKRLVALTYANADGTPAEQYPNNPNGSELACAALCDPTGRVLGMMPHPEAYLEHYLHPNPVCFVSNAAGASSHSVPTGLQIFQNIVHSAAPLMRGNLRAPV